MALAPAGLQTHIWNNNVKSMAMLALYPLFILAIIWGCVYVVSGSMFANSLHSTYTISTGKIPATPAAQANAIIYTYWPMILAGVALWFMVAFFFHTK